MTDPDNLVVICVENLEERELAQMRRLEWKAQETLNIILQARLLPNMHVISISLKYPQWIYHEGVTIFGSLFNDTSSAVRAVQLLSPFGSMTNKFPLMLSFSRVVQIEIDSGSAVKWLWATDKLFKNPSILTILLGNSRSLRGERMKRQYIWNIEWPTD